MRYFNLLAIVLFIVDLFPFSHEYSLFIRIALFVIAILNIVKYFSLKNKIGVAIMLSVMILYNPFIPITFSTSFHGVLNAICAYLFYSAFRIFKTPDKR